MNALSDIIGLSCIGCAVVILVRWFSGKQDFEISTNERMDRVLPSAQKRRR